MDQSKKTPPSQGLSRRPRIALHYVQTSGRIDDLKNLLDGVLVEMGFNTLILNLTSDAFRFTCRSKLAKHQYEPGALEAKHCQAIAKICQDRGLELIVGFNILSHQKHGAGGHALLSAFPQFAAPEEPWKPDVEYNKWQVRVGPTVRREGCSYVGLRDHISSSSNAPGTGSHWRLFWRKQGCGPAPELPPSWSVGQRYQVTWKQKDDGVSSLGEEPGPDSTVWVPSTPRSLDLLRFRPGPSREDGGPNPFHGLLLAEPTYWEPVLEDMIEEIIRAFSLPTPPVLGFDSRPKDPLVGFHVRIDEERYHASQLTKTPINLDGSQVRKLFAGLLMSAHRVITGHGLSMIMFHDMLTEDGHNREAGMADAIDDIPKDIIIDFWGYGHDYGVDYQYFIDNGFALWPTTYCRGNKPRQMLEEIGGHLDGEQIIGLIFDIQNKNLAELHERLRDGTMHCLDDFEHGRTIQLAAENILWTLPRFKALLAGDALDQEDFPHCADDP